MRDKSADRGKLAIEIVDQRFTTYRTVIRTIGWCFALFMAKEALVSLAGQTTNLVVSATLSVLADFKFVISITLAGSCAAWALVERALRHRKVEKLAGRIRELETAMDPKRSSSNLTPKGKTNPKDKKQ